MWVNISHGKDNKPLDSAEGEGLISAEDEWLVVSRLRRLDKHRLIIFFMTLCHMKTQLIV